MQTAHAFTKRRSDPNGGDGKSVQNSPILNAMSIDIEDWFQVGAFEKVVSRDDWDHLPSRVERNSYAVLELFAEADVKATFFTLGWIAERFPALIRRFADAGHEVASHGSDHDRVFTFTRRSAPTSDAPAPRSRTRPGNASTAIARRVSRSTGAIRGRTSSSQRRAMATPRASRRSRTTITDGVRRRASRFGLFPMPT